MKSGAPLVSLADALSNLCTDVKTQSQGHIRPIHAYSASRLVLEGGFPPEWVHPRQSYSSRRVTNGVYDLTQSAASMKSSEQRVLGGIKY